MVMSMPKRLVTAALIAGLALLVGASATALPAQQLRLEQAQIFFEFNSSAQDLGIQVFLDGEGWTSLKIIAPGGKQLLDVTGKGSVGLLGLTELFFESVEPSTAEGGTLSFDEILALFPEGKYDFRTVTVEGQNQIGSATLTHDIPDGPVVLSPLGGLVDLNNTVISWLPVRTPAGIKILRYQVIVERSQGNRVFTVDLPPNVTSVKIPKEFLKPDRNYIFEVLAKEVSGNQTITEGSFTTK
jgi:hypothetical protein